MTTIQFEVHCFHRTGSLYRIYKFNCGTPQRARDRAREALYREGRQPNYMTLVAKQMHTTKDKGARGARAFCIASQMTLNAEYSV